MRILKLFQKSEDEEMIPNSFYTKSRKMQHKKKTAGLMIIDGKILYKILAKQIHQHITRSHSMIKLDIVQ